MNSTAPYIPMQPIVKQNMRAWVRFEDYTRWQMVKALLDNGASFKDFAQAIGWKKNRVISAVIDGQFTFTLQDVSHWFYVLGVNYNASIR